MGEGHREVQEQCQTLWLNQEAGERSFVAAGDVALTQKPEGEPAWGSIASRALALPNHTPNAPFSD
jgi:hypothetical protein